MKTKSMVLLSERKQWEATYKEQETRIVKQVGEIGCEWGGEFKLLCVRERGQSKAELWVWFIEAELSVTLVYSEWQRPQALECRM